MTIAQTKAARRRGNRRRRAFGPGPADTAKTARREREKMERLRAIQSRSSAKNKKK
jgi:hypothetical protein